jgi:hypothetical protein
MLDHDAPSFSLVPFCYGVCPFVNQLHPLPSAISGIPDVLDSVLQHMQECDFYTVAKVATVKSIWGYVNFVCLC